MSKSKGNVIDPLGLIDQYGADALRFTLTSQAAQGRNIRLSEARVEGYRNFSTKLWNAARFCEMNECASDPGFDPASATAPLNQWIIHEANQCAAEVSEALEAYRFNEAAGALYKFIWNVFCDWYLELAKPSLQGDDATAKAETQKAAAWTLDQILKLLHPIMPFITEELWACMAPRDEALITTDWPAFNQGLVNSQAADEMNWAIGLITAIRSVRSEMNVPAGAQIPLAVVAPGDKAKARLSAHGAVVKRLARINEIAESAETPQGAIQVIFDETTFALPLADVIDIDAEKARLEKEITKAEGEITKIDKKLGNENFVAKAPPAVVEEQKSRRADYAAQGEKLSAALERLKTL